MMESVLFKISYLAEFHVQMIIEAAHVVPGKLKALCRLSDNIKSVHICMQEVAIHIMDKQGSLTNFAVQDGLSIAMSSDNSQMIYLHFPIFCQAHDLSPSVT
jgi:hypothetical protein